MSKTRLFLSRAAAQAGLVASETLFVISCGLTIALAVGLVSTLLSLTGIEPIGSEDERRFLEQIAQLPWYEQFVVLWGFSSLAPFIVVLFLHLASYSGRRSPMRRYLHDAAYMRQTAWRASPIGIVSMVVHCRTV